MAVDDTHVFPGFFTPVPTQRFFPKPHAFAEVRGENTLERKFASTRDQTQPPGRKLDTFTTEPPELDVPKMMAK